MVVSTIDRPSTVYQSPKWPSLLCRELAHVDLSGKHDLAVCFRVRDSIFGTFGIHKSNVRSRTCTCKAIGGL